MRNKFFTKERVITAISLLLAVLGIFATVLGLKPGEWPEKIDAWIIVLTNFAGEAFDNKWKITCSLGVGLLIGYLANRRRPPNVLTAAEFAQKYQEILSTHDVRTLRIFGYTFETVRDYQKYEHFYQDGLHIRVLNRCWVAEKKDEDAHNRKIESLNLRIWRKSETIRQAALSPWTYKARREVRYYDFSHPIIKGVLLRSKNSVWAFVNFYKWEEVPPDGGSQFKGADLGMIYLDGANPQERLKIDALESQFELIWKHRSYSLEQARKQYEAYID